MLRTIALGSCVSVQGRVVRELACGTVLVKVGERVYAGLPVSPTAA
jgi:hypothetical protein